MSLEGEAVEVFVICPVKSIERGEAKAFSLSRVDEEGGARPFSIVVIRTNDDGVVGYINSCPHARIWLNFGAGEFFNADRTLLKCGRHGSLFEIETGVCVEGPCSGKSLEPIALAVVDDEICLCGVALVEDNRFPNPFVDEDDTMEIMIHPE
jgi:nitrite reductase/ring-hydroxylating ferredoxin subunit